MSELLAEHLDVVVSSTVENQPPFDDRFEHVVLLSCPLPVLLDRVRGRPSNPYGRTPEQQAEIAKYLRTAEPAESLHGDLTGFTRCAPVASCNANNGSASEDSTTDVVRSWRY